MAAGDAEHYAQIPSFAAFTVAALCVIAYASTVMAPARATQIMFGIMRRTGCANLRCFERVPIAAGNRLHSTSDVFVCVSRRQRRSTAVGDQRKGVPRDHQLLVGRYGVERDPAVRS
jgi:hypothetical protein